MTAPSNPREALADLISLCERKLYPQPDKPNSDWMRVQAAKAALATLSPKPEAREVIDLRRIVLDTLNGVAPAFENLACNQEQADMWPLPKRQGAVMTEIVELFEKRHPRRFYGECQRCQRTDYLPWATEHGIRYCGHCWERDAVSYTALRDGGEQG